MNRNSASSVSSAVITSSTAGGDGPDDVPIQDGHSAKLYRNGTAPGAAEPHIHDSL